MSLNYLQRIAVEMRAGVRRCGQASRTLGGGLILRMSLIGDTWSLALSRATTVPSTTEVETVRRDFAVPATAQQTSAGQTIVLCWSERPMQAVPVQQRLELV